MSTLTPWAESIRSGIKSTRLYEGGAMAKAGSQKPRERGWGSGVPGFPGLKTWATEKERGRRPEDLGEW